MKKLLALLLALVMILSMAFVLTGCDKDEDDDEEGGSKKVTIIGKWEAEVDMTDAINEALAVSFGDSDVKEYITASSFKVTMVLEFTEDELTVSCTEDSVEDAMEQLVKDFKKGMKKYFEDLLNENNIDMTVDQFIAQNTIYDTLDEYVDSIVENNLDLDSMMPEQTNEYKLDGDKLYGAIETVDSEGYVKIELSAETLKFVEIVVDNDAIPDYLVEMFDGISFTKKK